MLHVLVPSDVVWRHKDEIYEVMGELAEIVEEEDGSSWPFSKKKCVEAACICFQTLALADLNHRLKLTSLVCTWEPEWPF